MDGWMDELLIKGSVLHVSVQ